MLHVMGEARNELTRVDEEDPTSTLAPRCRKGAIHPNRAVPRGSADMSCSPCAEFGNGGTIPACCLRGPFGVSFLMSASPGSTTRASARDERPTAVVSALRDQAPAEVPKRDAQALSLRWHLAGCLARCVAGACFRTERDRKRSGGHGQGGCTLR
jgi:hypothetical protein